MPVELRVYNPSSAVEATQAPAPRLSSLRGKKIGFLWNGMFRGDDVFPVLQRLLKERFPDANVLDYRDLPSNHPDAETIGKVAKEKGVDAVIGGMGG